MKYNVFAQTNRSISEVGMGCWQLGGDFGPISEETALETLNAALENGITFFDTADVYGQGRSESLIGRFLRNIETRPFIATKFGRDDSVYPNHYSEDALRRSINASLERLNIETLDLVQLHCVPIQVLQDKKIFDWLRRAQQDGLITSFGASVENDNEALECLKHPDLASLQIIFNIYRQKPLQTIFPLAKKQSTAIIVRLPLASGLLSGHYTKHTTFAASDHRNYNRDGQKFSVGETFAGLPFEKGVELTDSLKQWIPHGMSVATMALRWILDQDAVTVIIPGASSAAQAQNNASASNLAPLSAELHLKLANFYKIEVAPFIRGTY